MFRTLFIIGVPIVTLLTIFNIACIILQRKSKKEVESNDEIPQPDSLQYDLESIRVATNNFSDANKLGQGGFGFVYKGTLSNGREIAVKRLAKNSGQGDLQFKNEVVLMAKLQHRNLVRLLGFCLEGEERLLIYEFVSNRSLDLFIFDEIRREQLDWRKRYNIIEGISRGLLYLHEDSRHRIIHRDLKASNILVDAEMNAKISDFGIARLFTADQTQGDTSKVVGTYGYMSPEYLKHGNFSVKSDVFSFGVVLLEIVSGRKNSSFTNGETTEDLLSYAWRNWREGTALNIVDPLLLAVSQYEIMRCIHVALSCVQENVSDRPTMTTVIVSLASYTLTLPVPSQPGFHHNNDNSIIGQGRSAAESDQSKNNSIGWSNNEVSITELDAR